MNPLTIDETVKLADGVSVHTPYGVATASVKRMLHPSLVNVTSDVLGVHPLATCALAELATTRAELKATREDLRMERVYHGATAAEGDIIIQELEAKVTSLETEVKRLRPYEDLENLKRQRLADDHQKATKLIAEWQAAKRALALCPYAESFDRHRDLDNCETRMFLFNVDERNPA